MKFWRKNSVPTNVKGLTFLFSFLIAQFSWSQSSVLANGQWYKIAITESGIYKLDLSALTQLGLDASSINPQQIRLYGNGLKGTLPQPNSEARPVDLIENAIRVIGESDASFDANDYILFYAQGPDKVEWTENGLDYEKNIYSDTAYYFLTTGSQAGSRMVSKASLPGSGTAVTTFDDYVVFEDEVNNILSSGRGWYGDLLDNGEIVQFTQSIEGVASPIELVISGVSQSPESNTFDVVANGASIGSLNLSNIPSGPGTTYSIKAMQATDTFAISQSENIDLRVTFDGNSPSGRGYLDFYAMTFERQLRLYDNATFFRTNANLGGLINYQVSTNQGVEIWDVTDPTNVQVQAHSQSGGIVSFQSQSTEVEEYVTFTGSDFDIPILLGGVENQDLRGSTNYDGIIIVDELFLFEAERLAQFHQTNDQLSIAIVTPEQIYNEFSSGRQDITAIRDYAKHVFEGGRLKYLLLFGDCSFDYKARVTNNTNFVPTYESRNSFHPIFSYSSDDYYGFFEDDEGEWVETELGDHSLEIGIGRLPVKTIEEAATVVDKIIYYSTSSNTLGKWRTQLAYVADDGDNNIHAVHADSLSALIDSTHSEYRINKLLLDAFNQEVGATSETSPETTRAIKARIKEGAFAINFIGHGNEQLWMEEQVLTNTLIDNLTNRNRMPIFVTATCEFGRYDSPIVVSGAERLLLNENGGAIALLTTSRPVFANTNFALNEAFHRNFFREEGGSKLRLGDIIRYTKNEGLEGAVNRNFTLLGDPMLSPAFPEFDVEITEFQGEVDTLSALEEVTLTGTVVDQPGFNGILNVVIFDEKQTFRTKGQQSDPYNYEVRSNALFRGEATVNDGEFSFTFVVPKTISYQYNQGKLSLYAWDEDSNVDASGTSRNFVIGGTNPDAPGDNTPPSIRMYLNDESFVNGATVAPSSLLIAHLSDENGITTSGNGLIQGISLRLGEETISVNEFYTSDLDTYQSGTVVYPLQDLAPGDYTLTLRAYDTHNNLNTSSIQFTVSDESFISLFNQVTYPNPVSESATFSFEHDREEQDLDILLVVYNAKGEIVNRTNYEFENSDRLVELNWNARTNSGQRLNRGLYFYRLIVKSRFDGAVKEIANKLVIVN